MGLKGIFFRFEKPREQQRELMLETAECVEQGQNLIAHAPTGLGKTDAVLSPCISYALSSGRTVFFLTPKISQHEIALDVVRGLNKKHSLSIKAVDLVGRKYMCVDPVLSKADFFGFYEICARRRRNEQCTYYTSARGNSKKEKEKAKLHRERLLNRLGSASSHHEVKSACLEYAVGGKERVPCAYELSLELAKDADLVIADYFHLLNPGIRKIMLSKLNIKPSEMIVIVDEAHNVPERVRSMLGSTLSNYALEQSANELERLGRADLRKDVLALKRALNSLARKKLSMNVREAIVSQADFSVEEAEDIADALEEEAGNYLEATGKGRSFQMQVAAFLGKWSGESKDVVRIIRSSHSKNVSLMVKALDPAIATRPLFRKAHSSILMSGTLLPTEMYADLLGFEKSRTLQREFSSPFPKENLLNLVVTSATTKYGERSEQEYEKIAGIVSGIVGKVPGNAAVFFPSFGVLSSVHAFLDGRVSRPILAQCKGMDSRQASSLLKKFRAAGKGFGAVLLAVAQGSFAEGIDYMGEQMLCSIVVGIPLQEMNLELKCLIDHYNEKFHRGWHYAYLYPAVSRAIQASGRVIRDAKDVGVAVFLDKRYTWQNYRKCFPRDFKAITTEQPEKYVHMFFDSGK